MSGRNFSVAEASANLGELIELVENGSEVTIVEGGRPRAKLVPVQEHKAGTRKFGKYRGQIRIAEDFDAPLPDEFWLSGNP